MDSNQIEECVKRAFLATALPGTVTDYGNLTRSLYLEGTYDLARMGAMLVEEMDIVAVPALVGEFILDTLRLERSNIIYNAPGIELEATHVDATIKPGLLGLALIARFGHEPQPAENPVAGMR